MRQILYLHGFNSSPLSLKSRQTQAWLEARGLAEHFHCPALPFSPAAAAAMIEDHFTRIDPLQTTCIGSSLGGFYATWAAERFACRAVLINPAVRPYRLLDGLLGPQRNLYSGEEYILAAHHMAELAALEPARLSQARYWLLAEEGDETLDYRDAVAYYAGCRQTVHEGGDHGFQRWQGMLPEVMAWAGLTAGS
ncbi:esterase [Chitinimonas arctica]|uniref:Esterase n=1 Tax=Chitinimonas arctica TaxID=2594795 RepID=A0A516SGK2_9NEIS|nr:YqiA/YcfP family alpha/beta fold hydrolase [Chitinimonas arctica]QDQ27230.1 esterase [Chitinimonas arctica]